MKAVKALLLFLFCYSISSGQNSIAPKAKSASITKSKVAITTDGVLDEPAWLEAEVLGDFHQQFPFDTSLAKSKTEVRILFDEYHIHISAVCYDNIEGDYVIRSLRRDFDPTLSDAFRVVIDPFNDNNNGFVFGVNPLNAQYEALIANGGTFGAGSEWDNKWFSAVKRESDRWTVEMAIPYNSIRFIPGNTQWRMNFIRQDLKRNELSVWNFVPRNFNSVSLAFTAAITWPEPPPRNGKNFAVIPYVAGEANRNFANNTNTKSRLNVGGDAKIGVSSSLNLDLTVNPDFSQADVDRQVTNLTRFSIFFPERRQFFLENSDLFAQFGFSQIRPFFSRRIGLENGNRIPIQFGARLSGKVNRNWRIGVLNVQTAQDTALNADAENFSVLCFQRQLKGRSYLGGIFVNRQTTESNTNSAAFNRVAGLDYRLASRNGRWNGIAFFHKSFTQNVTAKDDYAHATFLRYDDANWSLMWNHEYVGDNYRAASGFVPRQEQFNSVTNEVFRQSYWRLEPEIEKRWYPKSSLINNFSQKIYTSWYADSLFRTTEGVYIFTNEINFQNTARIGLNLSSYFTRLLYPIDITYTGAQPLDPGNYTYRDISLYGRSDVRRLLTGSFVVSQGSFYTGTKKSLQLAASYRWQPWGTFGINYSGDVLSLPTLDVNGEPTDFQTTLNLIGPQADISFSRQLFFSTIAQYATQNNNVNFYARLQWRFRPMSDLFIVYSDNYESSNFAPKNRALVLKLVWWFNT
ncbi:MAG: DUF5916 domain-containing protein [Bacteroidia bacterium]